LLLLLSVLLLLLLKENHRFIILSRPPETSAVLVVGKLFQYQLKAVIRYKKMNAAKAGYLFSKGYSKSDRPLLTQKEIAMLRLAKRSGTSLEAMAKLILLLRAKKKAVDQKTARG
jgi:hypothetical protein